MAVFKLSSSAIAFMEPAGTTVPRLRAFDWLRTTEIADARNPRSEVLELAVGETHSFFDREVALSTDGTTEVSVESLPDNVYRIRRTGGTNPVFRTSRSLTALVGGAVTITINSTNDTVTWTVSGGTFANIVAGDTLWLPGTEESVTSPFDAANLGFWSVVSASTGTMVLQRLDGFDAEAEGPITVASATEVRAFASTSGIQVNDQVLLGGGFASANHGLFGVINVTDQYFDIFSSVVLAEEEDVVPTAAGLLVFRSPKRWVQVEADQAVAVRFNGDATNLHRLQPWDSTTPGTASCTGPTWALEIVNLSTSVATVTVQSVE